VVVNSYQPALQCFFISPSFFKKIFTNHTFLGADFVEMDVQLTKDHQVVVYHDFDAVVISKKVSVERLPPIIAINIFVIKSMEITHACWLADVLNKSLF
ncbi:unnamed protein product, partial [Trichobilharzia regenti]